MKKIRAALGAAPYPDPEQIRTADLPLRRRTLYPAELQDRRFIR